MERLRLRPQCSHQCVQKQRLLPASIATYCILPSMLEGTVSLLFLIAWVLTRWLSLSLFRSNSLGKLLEGKVTFWDDMVEVVGGKIVISDVYASS